ncbi:MAG: Flp pilus assembly protein CpaB [Pseudomonadota bacterium]
MSKMRLLILLIAVGAGGAAFFLVSSNETENVNVAALVPQNEGPEMVRVLVAAENLAQGAVVDAEKTKWVKWPKSSVPEFYITEENKEFYDGLPQTRTRRLIRENEAIFAQNTVRHGEGGMMAAIMTPGMRAVTVRVSAEQTSGGFILPGDRVDVFAFGVDLQDSDGRPQSKLLLPNVRVLAIDQLVDSAEGQSAIIGRTVTLEVTPEQVKRFIASRENQTMTLVLRSIFDANNDNTMTATEPDQVVIIRYGQG